MITTFENICVLKKLCNSTETHLRYYFQGVNTGQNLHESSTSLIGPVPTKYELFLLCTREWDQRGNLGMEPVHGLIKNIDPWWNTMLRHILVPSFLQLAHFNEPSSYGTSLLVKQRAPRIEWNRLRDIIWLSLNGAHLAINGVVMDHQSRRLSIPTRYTMYIQKLTHFINSWRSIGTLIPCLLSGMRTFSR